MTGPDHYREAEQLIRHVEGLHPSDDATDHLALAQVHATLAHAAATALPAILALEVDEGVISREWAEATS